jgi:hypothetical protein
MNQLPSRNRLLERLAELLAHRDVMEFRGTRDETDAHLLSVPLAPATWADLRALVASASEITPTSDVANAKRWQEIADQRAIEVADLRLALRWCVEHPGECLGDHPAKLKLAKEALK